jgi:hypothetical protein
MDVGWSLALVALIAIEAIREVPPGASHVLWRVPLGAWQVSELRSRFGRMWSWPCLVGGDLIVVRHYHGAAEAVDRRFDDVARLSSAWWSRAPNLLATLTSSVIVVVLPGAAIRAGLPELLLAACLALNMWLLTCIVTSAVDHMGQRKTLGLSGPQIRLCSPFAVLVLAGLREERRVSDRQSPGVIRALLDADTLQAFVRPTWYDMGRASPGEPKSLAAAVLSTMSLEERAALLERPPEGAMVGEAYCPRCGAVFQATVSACSDCVSSPALLLA